MATTISPTQKTTRDDANRWMSVSNEQDDAKHKRIAPRLPRTNTNAEGSITSWARRVGAALAVAAMLSGS